MTNPPPIAGYLTHPAESSALDSWARAATTHLAGHDHLAEEPHILLGLD